MACNNNNMCNPIRCREMLLLHTIGSGTTGAQGACAPKIIGERSELGVVCRANAHASIFFLHTRFSAPIRSFVYMMMYRIATHVPLPVRNMTFVGDQWSQ